MCHGNDDLCECAFDLQTGVEEQGSEARHDGAALILKWCVARVDEVLEDQQSSDADFVVFQLGLQKEKGKNSRREHLAKVLEASQNLVVVLDARRVGEVRLILHQWIEVLQQLVHIWLKDLRSVLHRGTKHE